MKFKNYLSLLMSCIMLAEPFAASAQSASSKSDKSKPSVTQFVKGKVSECSEWLDVHPKAQKNLKRAGIAAAVYVGLETLCNVPGEIWFNCASHRIPGLEKIDNPDGDIKKQEGLMWCWNACLQRAMHKYNFEKSQKEIYKGITNKLLVSPLKFRRNTGNTAAFSREELAYKNFSDRFLLKGTVFNEEIKAYVEEATGGQYTYQTLYMPWKFACFVVPSCDSEFYSDKFYMLCERLRKQVAAKNNGNINKAVLITLCPIVTGAHMITIEDTRDDKFIMGEPMAGITVSLDKNDYFKSDRDNHPYICEWDSHRMYAEGMPISFMVRKGNEISEHEWSQMMKETKQEYEAKQKKRGDSDEAREG